MVVYQSLKYAPVAELADALDLGSSIERCAGSIPVRCTKKAVRYLVILRLFYLLIFPVIYGLMHCGKE